MHLIKPLEADISALDAYQFQSRVKSRRDSFTFTNYVSLRRAFCGIENLANFADKGLA